MEIPFAGQLTMQDYARAQVLHMRPSRRDAVVRAVLEVLSALWFAIALRQVMVAPGNVYRTWVARVWPLTLLIAIPMPWYYPQLLARRGWRTHAARALCEAQTGIFSDQGYHYSTAVSEGGMAWAGLIKYRQSPDLVVLYQSPYLINIYPRSFFKDEADWQGFIALVAAKLPEAGAVKEPLLARPMVITPLLILAIMACITALLGLLARG